LCPGVNGERDKYHVFAVEFADDLITVDEWCTGGGGLVHTSKFSAFMALKVVVCIGSDFVENVFSVRLVGLGGRRGPGNVDGVHRSKVATGRREPLPDGSMSPIGNNPA
jgi:hypothetical protein